MRGPAKAPVTWSSTATSSARTAARPSRRSGNCWPTTATCRYVWRHLPLTDVHPHAQLAAEGSEAAARQGKFWEMHDQLLAHQGALLPSDLIGYARDLGLDADGSPMTSPGRRRGPDRRGRGLRRPQRRRRARRRSSSTAGATTERSTSARSPTRCARPGRGRCSAGPGCETEGRQPGGIDHDRFGQRGGGGHHRDRRRPDGQPAGLRRDADHRRRASGAIRRTGTRPRPRCGGSSNSASTSSTPPTPTAPTSARS